MKLNIYNKKYLVVLIIKILSQIHNKGSLYITLIFESHL